jgi:hypothetical protein
MARLYGIVALKIGGVTHQVKGHVDIDLGTPKRDAIVGQDGRIHGYTEAPKAGMISTTLTDIREISLTDLMNATDISITVDTSQKTFALTGPTAYTGDGTLSTEAGEVAAAWQGEMEELS